jgi:hypothetical protein
MYKEILKWQWNAVFSEHCFVQRQQAPYAIPKFIEIAVPRHSVCLKSA